MWYFNRKRVLCYYYSLYYAQLLQDVVMTQMSHIHVSVSRAVYSIIGDDVFSEGLVSTLKARVLVL